MNVAQLIHAHPHPPARTHPGYPEVTCENPVDCSIQQSSPELTNLHSTTTYDRHPNTHLTPPTIHPRISDVPTLPPLPQQIPNSILSSKVRTHPGYEEVPYGSPNHRSPPDYTYDQLPQTPSNSAFEVYGERKKRRIKVTDDGKMIEHREQLTDLQKRELNEMFRKSSYVDVARLSTIAKELGLEQKKITTWFQNKRYNMKKKEEKEGKKTTRGKEAERKVKNKDEAKGGEKEDVENAKEET
ncbi:hypothetical protein L596_014553 [Steinernema carpocapsae]|uniref:Homeobox domain-containing protein n=1 Tax=Steinernema carpocapsae TaxID=34508 RepID=A0A4U5ND49_STECR|nr:hypothetical protein L596_014553 [Steinernema carpocapsae]